MWLAEIGILPKKTKRCWCLLSRNSLNYIVDVAIWVAYVFKIHSWMKLSFRETSGCRAELPTWAMKKRGPGCLFRVYFLGMKTDVLNLLTHHGKILQVPVIIGGEMGPISMAENKWAMKKTWLFRVDKGLYYPVMWGLFHKPKKIRIPMKNNISWKVSDDFFPSSSASQNGKRHRWSDLKLHGGPAMVARRFSHENLRVCTPPHAIATFLPPKNNAGRMIRDH